MFILGSNLVLLKGSNIQPQAGSDVAEFRLAFAIVSALFRPTTIGLTRQGALLLSPPLFYEISARFNDQDRCLHHRAEAAPYEEVCHRVAIGAAPHLQPDLHRMRTNSRILDLAQRHHDAGGLFG